MPQTLKSNAPPRVAETGAAALRENIESAKAANTRRAYESAWRAFAVWCREWGHRPLPCDPYAAGVYLSELGARSAPATVHLHAAAISHFHVAAGEVSPCAHPGVRQAVAGHRRRSAHAPDQPAGIDASAFERITETVSTPRVTRGGRTETKEEAQFRGLVDVCLIGLMRDALLRRSEAVAATWGDLSAQPDGTGRLLVRKSKSDQDAQGSVRFVSADIYETLAALRLMVGGEAGDSIFPLGDRQVCRRIAAAAKQAGLPGNFSGHSPRIGMAQDLALAGTSLPALMQAGGWKSSAMPAHYTRAIEAGRGAVAQWYGTEKGSC